MIETTQINVRMDDTILCKARKYAQKHGFGNVQELIKETLRERLFGEVTISREEFFLVQNLAKAAEEKNLWGTEKELFKKLRR